MRVESVSVGLPADIEFGGKRTTTGIFKRPVEGPVFAGLENLDGDGQADLSVHGGRDKAIYCYSRDYYPLWADELGRPLEDAQFGENLTLSGGRDEDVVIGSLLRIGEAEATVCQPRIPCFKLGIRVGDEDFPNRFWTAGRLGFYLRVEATGNISPGDAVTVLDAPAHGITVHDLWTFVIDGDAAGSARALDVLADLDDGWCRRLRLASRDQ